MRILLCILLVFIFSCKEKSGSVENETVSQPAAAEKEADGGCDFFYFEKADSEDRGNFLDEHGDKIDRIIMAKYDSFRTLNSHEVANCFMILDIDNDPFNPFYVYAVDEMDSIENPDSYLAESFADYYFDFFTTQPCSFYEHLQSKNTSSYTMQMKNYFDFYFENLGDPAYKDSIRIAHNKDFGKHYQKQITGVFGN